MQGYPITFNIYAESPEEAELASQAIKDFISAKARVGVAVTAYKVAEAVARWSDSIIVTNYFR